MRNEARITVTGWVGTNVRFDTPTGAKAWANFRMASTRSWPDGNGGWAADETLWFTVKCWGETANHVAASIRKGLPVIVHGHLVDRMYRTPEGAERIDRAIHADAIGLALTTMSFAVTQPRRRDPGEVAPVPAPEGPTDLTGMTEVPGDAGPDESGLVGVGAAATSGPGAPAADDAPF